MHSIVPAAAAKYFGISARFCSAEAHPIITSVFTPAKGWRDYPIRKRVSLSAIRKLRAEGVTGVELGSNGRHADFLVSELTK